MAADIYLLSKYARAGIDPSGVEPAVDEHTEWE